MKAYQMMMFLIVFNLFFWVVTVGLGIYAIDESVDPGFDLTNKRSAAEIGMGLLAIFSFLGSFEVSIIALSLAIAGGAMIGIFTAGQGSQGIVYGLFGYFFWSSTSNTLTVFWNLSNSSPGVLYVLIILAMIIGLVFVAGLFQMVTQGWKSFD